MIIKWNDLLKRKANAKYVSFALVKKLKIIKIILEFI
jgi:hypothetical protein